MPGRRLGIAALLGACNKWTARGLRATGAPITPFYAIRAANVFSQASKFGTTVRELSEAD